MENLKTGQKVTLRNGQNAVITEVNWGPCGMIAMTVNGENKINYPNGRYKRIGTHGLDIEFWL